MSIQILQNHIQQLLPEMTLDWSEIPELPGFQWCLLDASCEQQSLHTDQVGLFWQNLPYWAFAWAGGVALSKYLLAHPEKVVGKRVLDFGCGSGLAGVVAAKLGAASVDCCDLDEVALQAAQLNARQNGVTVNGIVDWQNNQYDCLLAADVLYDLTSVPDLAKHCAEIPGWIVAETNFQTPPWQDIKRVENFRASTWPRLDDFDDQVAVNIFER
jgi:predicted nicotinamide N-methyase